MNGILNIYKEKGYTSHDVVNIVRKLTKCKAGHTGTLDPDAEGVLPVCLGRATKIADYLMAEDKEYVAQVILGISTDTGDASGQILAEKPFLGDLFNINSVLQNFIGQIVQIPPMYSAIKVQGKKLYEYAREGVSIERRSRLVTVRSIEILEVSLPTSFVIRVNCSKGTYIRTLCADIGESLGSVAHMGELLRTRSGSFRVEDAVKLGDLEEFIDRAVIPIDIALGHMPKIIISSKADKWLKNGNKIPLDFVQSKNGLSSEAEYLAYDEADNLAGIYVLIDDCIKPKVMLL